MFFEFLKNYFIILCDAPEPWQTGFQDPATPAVEGMIHFHNYLLLFLIVIGMIVFWLLYKVVVTFNEKVSPKAEKFTHSSLLEIIWTILPAIVLLLIAIPSFTLLYSLDELIDPTITLKVIGHQWYWSYEYSDYNTLQGGETLAFDSYLINIDDLTKGAFRLLEVDNRVILPINTFILATILGILGLQVGTTLAKKRRVLEIKSRENRCLSGEGLCLNCNLRSDGERHEMPRIFVSHGLFYGTNSKKSHK